MGRKLADVTAVILAGGSGTRLRPVVSDRVKPMAEVDGRPFIEFVLDEIAAAGVESVVLCTGYKAAHLEETLGAHHGGLRLEYSVEASPLGTAGALRLALPALSHDPVLVLNGDSYCTSELETFLDRHRARKSEASVMLVHVDDTREYGSVELDDEDRIIAFREKSSDAGAGWINAGVYLLSPDLIATVPAGRPVSIEKEMFPAWVSRGVYGYRSGGKLLDIGTPERYASASHFFTSIAHAYGGKGGI